MAMRTRFKWTGKPPANSSVKPRNDILAAHFFIDRPALINDPFGGKWTESLAGYSTSAALIGADGYRYEAINISGYYRGLKKPDVSIGSIEPGFIAVDIKTVGSVSKPIVHKGSWTGTLGHWGTIQYNATSGYLEFNRGGYTNYRTWQINAPKTTGVFAVTWSTKSITETPIVYHNGVEVTVTSVGGSGTGDAVEWDTAAYILGNIDAAGYSVGFAVFGKSKLSNPELSYLTSSPYNFFFNPPKRVIYFDVGGGATTLTIQDAAHAHAADAPVLTTNWLLTVADAAHAHTADGIILTSEHVLAVADALHAHAADSLGLTTDSLLAVQDAAHAHAADNVVLDTSNATQLTLQDATHAHTADAPALTTDTWLAIAEAVHANLADNVTLTTAQTLAILEAMHAHAADNVVLWFGSGVTTPDARTLQIAHELRALIVAHENRTRSIL